MSLDVPVGGNAVAERPPPSVPGEILQQLATGNLARLPPEGQALLIRRLCEALGLNPLTAPFEIINFKGRTVLYARRDCAEQLRRRDGVSLRIVAREQL